MINGSMAMSCPKLDAELARARQRERLTAKIAGWNEEIERADQRRAEQRSRAQAAMNTASAELVRLPTAKVANSDAKALARYLAALGVDVTPERLNDLLVLLAVFMIEAGGGLSLAVGMALSGPVRAPKQAARAEHPPAPALNALNTPGAVIETLPAPVFSPCVQRRSDPATAVQTADIVGLVRIAGGTLRTTTRRLGVQLGRSAASVHGESRRRRDTR
jgi:hypothetical protein